MQIFGIVPGDLSAGIFDLPIKVDLKGVPVDDFDPDMREEIKVNLEETFDNAYSTNGTYFWYEDECPDCRKNDGSHHPSCPSLNDQEKEK